MAFLVSMAPAPMILRPTATLSWSRSLRIGVGVLAGALDLTHVQVQAAYDAGAGAHLPDYLLDLGAASMEPAPGREPSPPAPETP